jgi:tetratricopeptide (TPR) repeat protein
LRAIEQVRQEAKAAARQNAESITGRLSVIEQSLAGERQRELEAIQKWNLLTLVVVGGFASVGFLGLLLVAPFLVRALNRMSDAAANLQLQPFARPALPGAESSETALLANPAVVQSTARFLDAMDRIEKRIHQLEQTVQSPELVVDRHSNGGPKPLVPAHDAFSIHGDTGTRSLQVHPRAELVLEKGQSLLHLGDAERALACFEEAVAADPESAEAHIKKGQALEKLRRSDEALASYDRAIALEKSATTAYLCKGALLNQLARYNEALECYERALSVQEGHRPPPEPTAPERAQPAGGPGPER